MGSDLVQSVHCLLLEGQSDRFERLGDDYFSWWYVQDMLPHGTGISFYAFI